MGFLDTVIKDSGNEFASIVSDGVAAGDVDNYVDDLANSFGALGSKLTGAGFGGAIVTLVKKELVEELKKYILDNYPNAKFI